LNQTIPGAGPFYFKGSDIGILMIPGGGGGTCSDLKPLAEDLNEKTNYTIHIPLLPGFGTSPDDLRTTTIEMWKEALRKEFIQIKNKCQKIIVGGHSLGGVFSLLLAKENNIEGLFSISTPIGIRNPATKIVPIISKFVKYHSIPSEKFKRETNGKWVGYDKIPLNVVKKYKILMSEMKGSLSKIYCPIILFQGQLDREIRRNSMDYIYSNIGSEIKKQLWLEHNAHPILNSPDHYQIVEELRKFISKITS
jgi:carboxylesterase